MSTASSTRISRNPRGRQHDDHLPADVYRRTSAGEGLPAKAYQRASTSGLEPVLAWARAWPEKPCRTLVLGLGVVHFAALGEWAWRDMPSNNAAKCSRLQAGGANLGQGGSGVQTWDRVGQGVQAWDRVGRDTEAATRPVEHW